MRLFYFFTLLVLAFGVQGRTISGEEAAKVAQEMLGKEIRTSEIRRAGSTGTQADRQFHIFNSSDGEGFVVVSADDRARKILAYSATGRIDQRDLPPQLSALLEQYARDIENLPDGAAVHASWKESMGNSRSGGMLMTTAKWGQGAPYNLHTPSFGTEHAPTGCVATAMAIVMKYHNWPEQGRGQYTSGLTGMSYDFSTLTPSLQHMPMTTEEMQASEQDSENIAKLMAGIGVATDMDYNENASGAYDDRITGAYRAFFKYQPPRLILKTAPYRKFANYSDAEWTQLIRGELDAGRPLLYSASSLMERHCFVIDGYSEDGLFHINWGWDGISDGYFALSAADPDAMFYTESPAMVIGIEPDREATQVCEPVFIAPSTMNDGYGLQIDYYNRTGNDMDYLCYLTGLHTLKGCDISVAPAFVDKDMNMLSFATHDYFLNIYNNDWGNNDIPINSRSLWYSISRQCPTNAVGVGMFYRQNNSSDWKLVKAYHGQPNVSYLDGRNTEYVNLSFDVDPLIGIAISDNVFGEYAYDGLPAKMIKGAWFGIDMSLPGGDTEGLEITVNGKDVKDMCLPVEYGKGDIYYILGADKEDMHVRIAYAGTENIEKVKIGELYYILNHDKLSATVTYKENYSNPFSSQSLAIPSGVNYKGKDYSVVEIGESAFNGCISLKNISLPASVRVIGKSAFESCKIVSVDIPRDSELKEIGYAAFYGTNLTAFYFPEGLESIGQKCFAYHKMGEIRLPASLKHIGAQAFSTYGQTRQENVYVNWENPESLDFHEQAFDESSTDDAWRPYRTLYVPAGTKDRYMSCPAWSVFDRIVEQETGIDDIQLDGNGQNVAVYDMNGRRVYTGAESDIPELMPGVYVVRSAAGARKIVF